MQETIIEKFGNRLRVRVCGILIENGRILLVRHRSLGKDNVLWAPPGGGMNFGEDAAGCLIREFTEETGLYVEILRFLFTHEFLNPPLHAIELFFQVKRVGGTLKKGHDPEMKKSEQIIEEVGFRDFNQLKKMDSHSLHFVLGRLDNLNDLFNLHGYVKFEDFA